MTADPASFTQALDTLACRALGGPVASVRRMTGGASQEIWSIDVAGTPGFVLRRTPLGDTMNRAGSVPMETEAAVISAVGMRGVPVPRVAHVLSPEDDLGRGFVMTRIAGEALGRRIVHDEAFAAIRPALAGRCGTILRVIHATPVTALPALPVRSAAASVASLDAQLRTSAEPRPVFEAALVWLRDHCPADTEPRLVHGDFRTGNFLVEPDGIAAILDWEGCHLGDPAADLGWLCMPIWRFGRLDQPVGGFGARADLIAGYGPVDPARLRFWEVFGMLRWGMTCIAMAAAFLAGDRSIERAAVGRRASEAELELLHALTGGGD